MNISKFTLRSTACSMHCSANREAVDSFYLNGKIPGAYLPDNTQTEYSSPVEQGVFAVFSGLHQIDKSAVSLINEFSDSILSADKVAIASFIDAFNEKLKATKEYSFAMIRIKNGIARIAYHGSCNVYIYRSGKTIPLTSIKTEEKGEKDEKSSAEITFTPEFKFLDNDAILLCTSGVTEKLNPKIFTHIFSNTQTSKASAQSITLSANENHCLDDATALVLRVQVEEEVDTELQSVIANTVKASKNGTSEKANNNDFAKTMKISSNIASELHQTGTLAYISTDDESEEEQNEQSLGLGVPAWSVIGVLTAALGVISGLITLIYV